jgi:hypothetical protein
VSKRIYYKWGRNLVWECFVGYEIIMEVSLRNLLCQLVWDIMLEEIPKIKKEIFVEVMVWRLYTIFIMVTPENVVSRH